MLFRSKAPFIILLIFLCFSPSVSQIKSLGGTLREGDVILSNHPCAGGSHLPDLTVITPVSQPCTLRAPPLWPVRAAADQGFASFCLFVSSISLSFIFLLFFYLFFLLIYF